MATGVNMSPRSIEDEKVKPGILVNKKLWEQFRERFKRTASKKIEELMESTLYPPEMEQIVFSSQDINSIHFNQPTNWNMSFTDQSITLENILYSSTSSSTSLEYIDVKNIEIE